jgi:hypothetical protein
VRTERRTGRSSQLKVALAAAVAALMLAFIPAASAASVDQIVQDAKDGRIDGAYSKSDLNAALDSPVLKTYGGKNGVEAVRSALGTQTEGTSGSGDLPFTGAEMVTFIVLGSTLLIAGFVLRRADRPE